MTKKIYLLSLGLMISFWACSDDNANSGENSDVPAMALFDDLPNCTESREGLEYMVEEYNLVYVCRDEMWIKKDQPISCYMEELRDGSGYAVVCGDESIGTLKNGKDGEDGEDGENGKNGQPGKNGASCTAEESRDGYKIVCDGDSLGFVKNGVNGTNGLSAYEVALAVGFEGTEEDWLASIRGADGANGTNGTNGINGTNGASCNAVATTNGYKIVCGGDSVGVVRNGTNGTNGTNGINGTNGTSCNAVATTNGYKIVCGGDSVGVVLNGTNGTNGTNGINGTNGASCNAVATTNGYKIVCGGDSVGVVLNGTNGTNGTDGVVTVQVVTTTEGLECGTREIESGFVIVCNEDSVAFIPRSALISSSSSETQPSSNSVELSSSSEQEEGQVPTCSIDNMISPIDSFIVVRAESITGCDSDTCSYSLTKGETALSVSTGFDYLTFRGEHDIGTVTYTLTISNHWGDGSCSFDVNYAVFQPVFLPDTSSQYKPYEPGGKYDVHVNSLPNGSSHFKCALDSVSLPDSTFIGTFGGFDLAIPSGNTNSNAIALSERSYYLFVVDENAPDGITCGLSIE